MRATKRGSGGGASRPRRLARQGQSRAEEEGSWLGHWCREVVLAQRGEFDVEGCWEEQDRLRGRPSEECSQHGVAAQDARQAEWLAANAVRITGTTTAYEIFEADYVPA